MRPAFSADESDAPQRSILILGNGIHTDIALPVDDTIRDRFAFVTQDGLDLDAPGVEWLLVGRGGRRFYTETPEWADLRFGAVWASFTRDRAVMHVQRAGLIDTGNPRVFQLKMPGTAYDTLVKSILDAFATDETGRRLVLPGTAYGADDQFYEATGWFNALLGCNVWTASMLRRAGEQVGVWTPGPGEPVPVAPPSRCLMPGLLSGTALSREA